ncbi:MAG: cysteine hydrolase family protein [Microthrixaceae bacterium]
MNQQHNERRRVAVLTMELQRGVVGEEASMPELRRAVEEADLLAQVARLSQAARAAGVPVVHATVEWRADRRGTPTNAPLVGHLTRLPGHLLEDTRAVQLDPAIRADLGTDLVSMRRHGMTPFTGTSLDALLRSLEVSDLVICGVSLNIGIPGAVFEAVGLGYRVSVPSDGVVGVPVSYGEQVLAHSIAPVASVTSVDEILQRWAAPGAPGDQSG